MGLKTLGPYFLVMPIITMSGFKGLGKKRAHTNSCLMEKHLGPNFFFIAMGLKSLHRAQTAEYIRLLIDEKTWGSISIC